MKETIHRFGSANNRRDERQRKMKCHSSQGSNADNNVPDRYYAGRSAI